MKTVYNLEYLEKLLQIALEDLEDAKLNSPDDISWFSLLVEVAKDNIEEYKKFNKD